MAVSVAAAEPTQADIEQLVDEIDTYLASRSPATTLPATRAARTAFDLPPVDELIAQAGITTGPAPRRREKPGRHRDLLPGRLWAALPDWALAARRTRRRDITITQHLQLTALVIQRYGWCSRGLRDRSGRRCIIGAQAVLYRLGYGDEHTAVAAGELLDDILWQRGVRARYYEWNDLPGRSEREIHQLLDHAIARAGGR